MSLPRSPAVILLVAFPLAAGDLELSVEPRAGDRSANFTVTLRNGSDRDVEYDPCGRPVVTSLTGGRGVICPDPAGPPCGVIGVAILAPGDSLSYEWSPEREACQGLPPEPDLYEVRWEGFSPYLLDRLEILPLPAESLGLVAEPAVVRLGNPVHLTLENTSPSTLTYNRCCFPPRILDSQGLEALCLGCPECFSVTDLVPGERLAFDWTSGSSLCQEGRSLPGRYRIIWGGVWDGSPHAGRPRFGAGSVLVLPPEDRRLELSLSASEARPGDRLAVTARNPLSVSVWYSTCCDSPIFIDALGLTSRCFPCVEDCAVNRREELPPGESLSTEVVIPAADRCALRPGPWSVVWGETFGLVPGSGLTPPVLGLAEVTVLPAGEPGFLRGDCDRTGALDVTDAVTLLSHLFLGSASPACPDACDSDDSGELDLTDAVRVLGYLFLGGEPPRAPFPAAGADPSPDGLGGCN